MKKNAPTGWNTHRKSSKRLPSAQLLIVECQAEKLNQQGLGLGAQVHAIVRKTFPQKSVEFVGTSTTSDLLQSLARFFVRKWNAWYGVLRHRKAFSVADSVRYGLWLACG